MTEHLLGVQKDLNLSPSIEKISVIYKAGIPLKRGQRAGGRERASTKLVGTLNQRLEGLSRSEQSNASHDENILRRC